MTNTTSYNERLRAMKHGVIGQIEYECEPSDYDKEVIAKKMMFYQASAIYEALLYLNIDAEMANNYLSTHGYIGPKDQI